MASSPPANRSGQLPQLSEDTLREMIAVQKQGLTVRLKEVERDAAEISYNKSVAQQSIDAQERDRKHEREEVSKRQKTSQIFLLAVVIVVLVFSGYSMWIGQTALVLDLVKIIVGFVGGMGYSAWHIRKKQNVE